MTELFDSIIAWFLGLGEQYGVNPILFGSIYVGAIPFFTLSVAWLVRNYRKGQTIVIPALSVLFFFVSAYLYLIIAGENVPWWVYLIVAIMIVGGGYSSYQKIQSKLSKEK